MILRMGCKMMMGAAGLAVAGALATGAVLGAAGVAAAVLASGRMRPPGARWPAEPVQDTDAGLADGAPVEP